ncbi:MAG: DUF4861 family protein [Saprospiraceae bacterium]|nr:DUF4861 family protein [Saprospiraceae bacterium]
MSKLQLLSLVLIMFLGSCTSEGPKVEGDRLFDIVVTNNSPDTLHQYGFELDLVRVEQDFHLMLNNKEVPVQIEDRNHNDQPDRLFTEVDLLPNSSIDLVAYPGKGAAITDKVKVHATLSDGEAIKGSHVVNFEERWAANGIIMENDWIGYRAIMSAPFAFDVIGKIKPDLLGSVMDIDIEKLSPWGGDALDEALSLGIGSPALYDLDKIIPLTQYDRREVSILANGPLRAEVEMKVFGVPVRGEKIDVLIRWQMEAGKHWSQVDLSILTKTDLNLQFAFGLPKHADATDFTQGLLNKVHFAYTYGLQSAGGEPLGMAILVPEKYEVDTYRDDPHNYFYLVNPINQSTQYRMMAAWVKGRLTIFDEIDFLDLVKKYTVEYGAEVSIDPDFHLSN